MARARSPERDKARKIWLDSGGKLTAKEVAEKAGAKPEQVRKWKSLDKWKAALEEQNSKRRRGGQPGNKNATGAGAPFGNANAETHGAYSTVHLADLPPEQRAYIESLTLDTKANMLHELQLLMAKETDLREKIRTLENGDADALYVDKVVQMLVPRPRVRDDDGKETEDFKDIPEFDGTDERYKTAMKTVIKASPFDRAMKLEAELNKIHGRIIKLLDSIKAYELESSRVQGLRGPYQKRRSEQHERTGERPGSRSRPGTGTGSHAGAQRRRTRRFFDLLRLQHGRNRKSDSGK